jgi:hypothetical protein
MRPEKSMAMKKIDPTIARLHSLIIRYGWEADCWGIDMIDFIEAKLAVKYKIGIMLELACWAFGFACGAWAAFLLVRMTQLH